MKKWSWQFVRGSFVDLKVPPFKGSIQMVQTSDPFEFEGEIDRFTKYTIVVQFSDNQLLEVYEVTVREMTSEALQRHQYQITAH